MPGKELKATGLNAARRVEVVSKGEHTARTTKEKREHHTVTQEPGVTERDLGTPWCTLSPAGVELTRAHHWDAGVGDGRHRRRPNGERGTGCLYRALS